MISVLYLTNFGTKRRAAHAHRILFLLAYVFNQKRLLGSQNHKLTATAQMVRGVSILLLLRGGGGNLVVLNTPWVLVMFSSRLESTVCESNLTY